MYVLCKGLHGISLQKPNSSVELTGPRRILRTWIACKYPITHHSMLGWSCWRMFDIFPSLLSPMYGVRSLYSTYFVHASYIVVRCTTGNLITAGTTCRENRAKVGSVFCLPSLLEFSLQNYHLCMVGGILSYRFPCARQDHN
jgi:hypothetical protein